MNETVERVDINGVRYIKMFVNDYIFMPIYIFIVLLALYIIVSKYVLKYIIKYRNNEIKEESTTYNLRNKLIEFGENMEDLNKEEFYSKLNLLFREYFEVIGIKGAFKLTLKELKEKDINKEILNLFEESYYLEFSTKNTRIETRKKILKTFIEYI